MKKYNHHCKICNITLKDNNNSLSIHISGSHKEITKEEYYLKYIGEKTFCKNCGNETKFKGIQNGYADCCCNSCYVKVNQWSGEKGEKRKQILSDKMMGNNYSIGRPKNSKNVNPYPMTEAVIKRLHDLNEKRRENDWWLGKFHKEETIEKMKISWSKKTDEEMLLWMKKRNDAITKNNSENKWSEKIEKDIEKSIPKVFEKLNKFFEIE